jgi:hypothetical protein
MRAMHRLSPRPQALSRQTPNTKILALSMRSVLSISDVKCSTSQPSYGRHADGKRTFSSARTRHLLHA